MKTRTTVLVAAFGLAAGPVRAEHIGPAALFSGKSPSEVASALAAACSERGFGLRPEPGTDVTCQGGPLLKSEFRPSRPPADPVDHPPQVYHRFSVSDSPDGAVVHERTSIALGKVGDRMVSAEPKGSFAVRTNHIIEAFYLALGGKIAPVNAPSLSPAPAPAP